MTTYIALLRGINVGGKKMIAMADLRALVAKLGFEDANSLLQSGNLVFRGPKQSTATLERTLEQAVLKQLKVETDFIVRTETEWAEIIASNPFREAAKRDPGHLVVMSLKAAPTKTQLSALQSAIKGREEVRGDGKQAYVIYPDGIGRSKLTISVIESKLGTRGTGRNWNTVLKLGALATQTSA